MADLILLSLNRRDIAILPKVSNVSEQEVVAALTAIWAGYESTPLACFLCDNQVQEFPPNTQFLPEPLDQTKAIGAPICQTCWGLPPMLRQHRCLKLLKLMHKARKTGRQFHFEPVRKHR